MNFSFVLLVFLFAFCEEFMSYYCCSECTQNIYNFANESELVDKVLKRMVGLNKTSTIVKYENDGSNIIILFCSIGVSICLFLILFFFIFCQLIQKNRTLEKKCDDIYKKRIDRLFNSSAEVDV